MFTSYVDEFEPLRIFLIHWGRLLGKSACPVLYCMDQHGHIRHGVAGMQVQHSLLPPSSYGIKMVPLVFSSVKPDRVRKYVQTV